jgi:cytochrome P450
MTEATEDTEPIWPFDRPGPLEPPSEYRTIRAACPFQPARLYNGNVAVIATRYEDVRRILGSPSFSVSARTPGTYPAPSAAFHHYALVKTSFDKLDPPEHDRERRMVQREFLQREVKAYEPFLIDMIDDILDDLAQTDGRVDLVDQLGHVVPTRVTCRLLGVPQSDAEYLRRQLAVFVSMTSSSEALQQAQDHLLGYFLDVVDAKTTAPGDDLASRLVADYVATGAMSRERAAGMLNVLLMGGFDTTSSMIALGTIVLLEHPDEIASLRRDPTLWPQAVEELLRYLTIAHLVGARVAKDDVEIDGHPFAAGDGVFASILAANWDPERFPAPERFDIDRGAAGHLAFGFGPHQCIGQSLARLELQLVFPRLFQRFPHMTQITTTHDVLLTSSSVVTPEAVRVQLFQPDRDHGRSGGSPA